MLFSKAAKPLPPRPDGAPPPPAATPVMRQVTGSQPVVLARPPPPTKLPASRSRPSPAKKAKSKLSDASSKDAPPSYASGSVVATPSRNQIIAVLNSMQQTPSNAIIAAIQREPYDPLHDIRGPMRDSTHPCRDYLSLCFLALVLSGIFLLFPILRWFLQLKHDLDLSEKLIGPGGWKARPDFALDALALIDPDTPRDKYTRAGWDGKPYKLVFSDEFNVDGRQFDPGLDPFWEAFDGWNAGTEDLQWYDRNYVTTKDGSLVITIDKAPADFAHNTSYVSGQLTSWNKLCFTGGYVEVRVSLPGDNKGQGFWPAMWLNGNLGKAGHGATTEGTWPYSYEACDVGTLPGQTPKGKTQAVPNALLGQRLSACTCPDETDHPGPKVDGKWVGRGAPEIDIFEGYVDDDGGAFSNALPMAPFDYKQTWVATPDTYSIYKSDHQTVLNGFGGTMQSEYAVTRSTMDQSVWGSNYATWGVEWVPTFRDNAGQITWMHGDQALWTIKDKAFPPDSVTQIDQRLISGEASYVLANIAMSETWHKVDLTSLTFPAQMRVDYVRIYQDEANIDLTCDPDRAPTADYIQKHIDAYSNAELLHWSQTSGGKGGFPRNSLVTGC